MNNRGLTTVAAIAMVLAVLVGSVFYASFIRPSGSVDTAQAPMAAKHGAGPAAQLPKMVEIYADWCPPCQKMKPILDQLEKTYKGKIVFQRVNIETNKDAVKTYNIKAIPVQIFYDRSGKQVLRHEGFYSKAQLVAQFKKMGIKPAK